jgi:hypothetical protein
VGGTGLYRQIDDRMGWDIADRVTEQNWVSISLLLRVGKERASQILRLDNHALDTAELFLEHSMLDLSDNLAENEMRPVAFKRRDWIYLASEHADPRVAVSRSSVGGSKSLFASYLGSVLPANSSPLPWTTETNRRNPGKWFSCVLVRRILSAWWQPFQANVPETSFVHRLGHPYPAEPSRFAAFG